MAQRGNDTGGRNQTAPLPHRTARVPISLAVPTPTAPTRGGKSLGKRTRQHQRAGELSMLPSPPARNSDEFRLKSTFILFSPKGVLKAPTIARLLTPLPSTQPATHHSHATGPTTPQISTAACAMPPKKQQTTRKQRSLHPRGYILDTIQDLHAAQRILGY